MRKLTGREKRLFIYLAILLAFVGWDRWRRRWSPDRNLQTAHYSIQSTATTEQTDQIGRVAESLYSAYTQFFRDTIKISSHVPKLKMRLYENREEFRHCNGIRNWAEAFYREPYCHQYYSSQEKNPYHWMLHEATHQLNNELARFDLEKWLDEGVAVYFGSSQYEDPNLYPGRIDNHTYPVWWLHILATTGDWQKDLENKSVIPLRNIITNKGGPDIDEYFNLYYLHWWTLTYFLFHYEDGKYRDGTFQLIGEGGTLEGFEKYIGPIEQVQSQWYRYIRRLKRTR